MTKAPHTPQRRPGEPGYVGRGHPPEHGKIRPGEVRNPYGRKGKKGQGAKPVPLDFAQEISELLAQPVRSHDGKLYTRAEIAVHSVTKGITDGKIAFLKLFFELGQKYQQRASAADDEVTDVTDQAILVAHRRQLLLSFGIDPDAVPAAFPATDTVSQDSADTEDEEADDV